VCGGGDAERRRCSACAHGGGCGVRRRAAVVSTLLRSWRWRAVAVSSMAKGEMVRCATSATRYHSRYILLLRLVWKGVVVNLSGVLSPLGRGCTAPRASVGWGPKMHLAK
jgi:hypothetical protein